MEDFKGKVAVITGGASGIGYAYAETFGREGAKIVLSDVEQKSLDAAVAKLRDSGIDAIGVVADVAKFGDVDALASKALEHFGKIHILCNNAGVSITGPIWLMSLDDWRWVYDVNVWGIIHGIKAFVPILMKQGEPAHIINTASLAAFNGTGDHAPYCSSKAAALSISQALYSEMKAYNQPIGVTAVCPGMVDTRIHQSWRNRPADDAPWSDREFAHEAFVKGSEAFQARGVPASEIAESALNAVRNNEFYVYSGDVWQQFVDVSTRPALERRNPRVVTWGQDLRPESEREPKLEWEQ